MLIERFGSTLNLNVYFHMLLLDGVYAENKFVKIYFKRLKAPVPEELAVLLHSISRRVARFLVSKRLLARDAEK